MTPQACKYKLLIILMASFILSCEQREWDNPFDPDCPKELFTPGSITAILQKNQIIVNWTQSNKHISGFHLYQNINDGAWSKIASLTIEKTTFTVISIDGGKKYGIKIIAAAGDNTSNERITYFTPILGASLSTIGALAITPNSATTGGNITTDGGASVIARGVCYGTAHNPDITGNKTANGTGPGIFTSNLTGLIPNTTYYVRAYATNSVGTTYGNEISFTTPTSLAELTTDVITVFNNSAANMGGEISSDGGLTVSQRGICYNTSQNPTISNNKVVIGNGTGKFSTTVINLTTNTTYYVRAYAINSKGTAYGNQVSFKTDNSLFDVDGNIYKTVIIGNQVWMAENLKTTKYSNGTAIPYVTDGTIWKGLTTGAYCYFQNSTANGAVYGGLYNFYAVIDNRNLCPSGWHVPTDSEWSELREYLGGVNVAGNKLKETGTAHWKSPNASATNSSGFTALPGSWRGLGGAFYYNVGDCAIWWTSSDDNNPTHPLLYSLWSGPEFHRSHDPYFPNDAGCSIRCLKD
jgi:uncharacterized protein (TIGR02145 family)